MIDLTFSIEHPDIPDGIPLGVRMESEQAQFLLPYPHWFSVGTQQMGEFGGLLLALAQQMDPQGLIDLLEATDLSLPIWNVITVHEGTVTENKIFIGNILAETYFIHKALQILKVSNWKELPGTPEMLIQQGQVCNPDTYTSVTISKGDLLAIDQAFN